jgi:hypothetical protein
MSVPAFSIVSHQRRLVYEDDDRKCGITTGNVAHAMR